MKNKRAYWYLWKKYFTETKKIKLKLHWKGNQYLIDKVKCFVKCQSKTRKINPIVVMEAWPYNIKFETTKGENNQKIVTAILTYTK